MALESDRVEIIECVAAYGRGEDPVRDRWSKHDAPGPSIYARWGGRARLHAEASDALDELESLRTRATDDARLRADSATWTGGRLDRPAVTLSSYLFSINHSYLFENLLTELAVLRAARIAIRLRLIRQSGSPIPSRLTDVPGTDAAGEREDPMTGENFAFEATAGSVALSSRIAESDPTRRPAWLDRNWSPEHIRSGLVNEFLAWRIP